MNGRNGGLLGVFGNKGTWPILAGEQGNNDILGNKGTSSSFEDHGPKALRKRVKKK